MVSDCFTGMWILARPEPGYAAMVVLEMAWMPRMDAHREMQGVVRWHREASRFCGAPGQVACQAIGPVLYSKVVCPGSSVDRAVVS